MLSRETLANILLAFATGDGERARDLVATTQEVDDEVRKALVEALTGDLDGSEAARRLGDALRSLSAEKHLVNECYRVAFYAGESWAALSSNPLYAFFTANKGGSPLDKWVHYFPIYERHLAPYRGQPVRALEIGVARGGGLRMLTHFLGSKAQVVGIDIDETVRLAAGPRYRVEIGDQADPEFLKSVSLAHGPFDIVVDDGGHTMRQQITSVETMFPLLTEGGTYIVEDCHTSYWPEYSEEAVNSGSFIEWAKARVDDLHAYHFSTAIDLAPPWQTELDGLHVYDSVVVLDKRHRDAPFSEIAGSKEFINYDRLSVATEMELIASRDAALARASQIEARVEARAAEVETHAAEVEAQANDIDAFRSELMDLRMQAAQQFQELEQTRSDLLGSWGIIREMRRSTSWRLTAPLRRAKSILRRS